MTRRCCCSSGWPSHCCPFSAALFALFALSCALSTLPCLPTARRCSFSEEALTRLHLYVQAYDACYTRLEIQEHALAPASIHAACWTLLDMQNVKAQEEKATTIKILSMQRKPGKGLEQPKQIEKGQYCHYLPVRRSWWISKVK